MKRPPPPLERTIQRQIVQALRAAGWAVWSTSQGYRSAPGGTRMAPGLPDLYCRHPRRGAVWIEVKRPGGRVREAQAAFLAAHATGEPRALLAYGLDDIHPLLTDTTTTATSTSWISPAHGRKNRD